MHARIFQVKFMLSLVLYCPTTLTSNLQTNLLNGYLQHLSKNMKVVNVYVILNIYFLEHFLCQEYQYGKEMSVSEEARSEYNPQIKNSASLDIISKKDRIVGGTKVLKGEFPWVIGIWRMKSSRPFCGGSLLNNR